MVLTNRDGLSKLDQLCSKLDGTVAIMQMKYCPRCGGKLALQLVEYRERPVCGSNAGGCGFIDFGRYTLGVGGLVVESGLDDERRALLIQRNQEPNRGGWTIPGGFVEFDETAEVAVVREVEEETGLRCEVEGLVGYRNRADPGDNTSYAIFLLRQVGGELVPGPTPEIAQAGFYRLEEMQAIERLAPLSYELAAAAVMGRLRVLHPVTVRGLQGRPPFTLFM